MRKMRNTRSSLVVPPVEESAVTMAEMMEMMRTLQENVEVSRAEQAKKHEDLVASQARNEELSKVNEELRQSLHEQRGRTTVVTTAPFFDAVCSGDHGHGGPCEHGGCESLFHRLGGS